MRLRRDRLIADIEALYVRDYQSYVRVARAITGDRERAIEAVQEGFANALQAHHTFRGEGSLEAWVWRIVVNAARAAARSPLVEVPRNGASSLEPPARVAQLAPLIAALPERQRHAVFLRYYADLDYRSIAAVLGIEVGPVSATLSAAHQAVRRALLEVVLHD
jgi:RNA polymerase sigma factor (sigma-70 family)